MYKMKLGMQIIIIIIFFIYSFFRYSFIVIESIF